MPASTGNWSLTDNLFDKVNFVQDTNAPLGLHEQRLLAADGLGTGRTSLTTGGT